MPKYLGWLRACSRTTAGAAGRWLVGRDLTYADLSAFQLVAGLRYAFPHAMAKCERRLRSWSRCTTASPWPRIAAYLASERRIPFNESGIFGTIPSSTHRLRRRAARRRARDTRVPPSSQPAPGPCGGAAVCSASSQPAAPPPREETDALEPARPFVKHRARRSAAVALRGRRHCCSRSHRSRVPRRTLPAGSTATSRPARRPRTTASACSRSAPRSAQNVLVLIPGTPASAAYFVSPAATSCRARRAGRCGPSSAARTSSRTSRSSTAQARHDVGQRGLRLLPRLARRPSITKHFELIPTADVTYAREWA